tara:strand:- start:97 stop:222 length:126 start_codon:yes stop_codon:yes gene_type:complete
MSPFRAAMNICAGRTIFFLTGETGLNIPVGGVTGKAKNRWS